MNYGLLHQKAKLSSKPSYSNNYPHPSKNKNIFGISDINKENKKNRDITPYRKYKKVPKKGKNNYDKNLKSSKKVIKLEEDINKDYFKKKESTPINKFGQKSNINKSPIYKSNLNSMSFNNSLKLNRPLNKAMFKNNFVNKLSKPLSPYHSPLNRTNKMNFNRAITPNNKLKGNNTNNSQKIKFNRSTTPIPKSKISLNKNNIKFGADKMLKNKKNPHKSPFSNKGFMNGNSLYDKNNLKKGLNAHHNSFKSKNIFAMNTHKLKVFTGSINISSSSLLKNSNSKKSSLINSPITEKNTSINNINIINNTNNNINHNNNIVINNNNSSFNILNKITDISNLKSNSSIIINGIQNSSPNGMNFNNFNPINQSINFSSEPKEIQKKILCMHEFSKTGYAGEDEKKINQDNYFVFRNFVNNVNYIFMAVCDGHGAVGQEISNFLKENLPIDLNHALRNKGKNILVDDISDIIKDIFIKVNDKLIANEMINSMLSGSTCVSVIYTPLKLITANVGDSRIILGKFNNNKWISVDLTRDHKPSLQDEEKRILSKNGRIEPMKDEDNNFIGPPRVWLKDQDYPGLAMSRSFGDRVAHSVGVSEEPEIQEYKFCKEDKFFVVASDGLFEFISSQEIVDIIKNYYLNSDIVGCCEYLYELSRDKWMKEEEVVDDITMILVFLEDQ